MWSPDLRYPYPCPNPNPNPNLNPNPTPKAEEWEDPWLGTVAPPGLEHAVARPYDRGAFPVRCAYARVVLVGVGEVVRGTGAAPQARPRWRRVA